MGTENTEDRPVQGGAALPVHITNETLPAPDPTSTQPVSIADGADVTQGARSDAAATTDTGTFSKISLFKRLLERLTVLIGLLPSSLGQKTRANSLSVTQASDATGSNAPQMQGTAADGAAAAGNPNRIAGKDGGNLTQTPFVSSAGVLKLHPARASDGLESTFSAGNADNSASGSTGLLVYSDPFKFNGTGWDRDRTPIVFKNGSATASGDTALWTPAASKKFRLMRYRIMLTGDATLAVAGILTVTLRDATTGLAFTHAFYVPSAAANVFGGVQIDWIDLGNGYLSAAANNVLNINLSVALATGSIRVVAIGTEE